MQQGKFIDVFLARHVSGATPIIRSIRCWVAAYVRVYGADGAVRLTAPSAPQTRPTQRLSRPPPIQNLGAENHMLQLNI